MDQIEKNLLKQIADLEKVPVGAYNLRANGEKAARQTTANIDIVSKENQDGIDIIIKENTKNESVHIPVIITKSGLRSAKPSLVYTTNSKSRTGKVKCQPMTNHFLTRASIRGMKSHRRCASRNLFTKQ